MASKFIVFACIATAAYGYKLKRESPIPQGADPSQYIGQISSMGNGFYPTGLNPSSLYGSVTGSESSSSAAAAAAPTKRESPIPQGADPSQYIGQISSMGNGFYPSGLNPSSLYGSVTGSESSSSAAAAAAPTKRESPIPQGADPSQYIGQISSMGNGFYPSGLNPSSLYGSVTGSESAAAPTKRESPIPQGADPSQYIGQISSMGNGFYPSGLNPSSLYGSVTGSESSSSAAAAAPTKRESPIPQGADPSQYIGQISSMGNGFYPAGFNPNSLYGSVTGSESSSSAAAAAPTKRESPIPQGADPSQYIGQISSMDNGFYPSGLNPSSLYSGVTGGSESAAASSS